MMLIPRKNDLWEDFFDDSFFSKSSSKLMKTDILEKDNTYEFNIDLPGFDKNDLKIEIENGYLTINASHKNEVDEKKNDNYVHRERFYGTCSRSFFVGDDIEADDIKASFKNGILVLTVPKKTEKEQNKKKYIEIGD